VDRLIHVERVRETIRVGRELPTQEIGRFGGYVSKFVKSFVDHSAGGPLTTTVVAVCEVFVDRYVVLTVYHAS
jgi:hypothetical protein